MLSSCGGTSRATTSWQPGPYPPLAPIGRPRHADAPATVGGALWKRSGVAAAEPLVARPPPAAQSQLREEQLPRGVASHAPSLAAERLCRRQRRLRDCRACGNRQWAWASAPVSPSHSSRRRRSALRPRAAERLASICASASTVDGVAAVHAVSAAVATLPSTLQSTTHHTTTLASIPAVITAPTAAGLTEQASGAVPRL